MGGVDKGLQLFNGVPLVQHAVQRLQAQVGGAPGLIAANANRNVPRYGALGIPVWPDSTDEFAGPLAGFQTALSHIAAQATGPHRFKYLLTTPCDSPRFPLDLLQRLYDALHTQHADIAMVVAPETAADGLNVLRAQPVFSLVKTSLQDSLQTYLANGGHKIDTWFDQHPVARVAFNLPQDDAHGFFNANTLEELHALERL